jgi:hypothetical protein
LDREQGSFDIDAEDQLKLRLGDPAERSDRAKPALAKSTSTCPFSARTIANSRSKSSRLATSPCTAVTPEPIASTALSNSSWRRPVIKTYAPSSTNRFAVANPMPLLPPVITAIMGVLQMASPPFTCGLDAALAVIGGKWKPLILFHLAQGARRYGELRRAVGGVTDKVLIQ